MWKSCLGTIHPKSTVPIPTGRVHTLWLCPPWNQLDLKNASPGLHQAHRVQLPVCAVPDGGGFWGTFQNLDMKCRELLVFWHSFCLQWWFLESFCGLDLGDRFHWRLPWQSRSAGSSHRSQ
ncbi:UNVERIFIED_CONTAM: hypothetical protein K2H54_005355 [Gekko kuhli]